MKTLAVLVWHLALLPSHEAGLEPAPLPHAREGGALADPFQDCFEIPRSICLRGSEGSTFVMGPAHTPGDLLLWYRFDKSLPVDESGHGHHLLDMGRVLSPHSVGPGILGRGGSMAFDGRAYRAVHSALGSEGQSFSVTLWIYLREDSVGSWRTIFKKGSGAEELMPALLLWPSERRLQVRMSPRADVDDAVLNSVGMLPMRRWTHVAVSCAAGGVLRLYINGVKDGEVVMDSPRAVGGGELYLGRDPWRAGVRAYVDDFRWYARAISVDEVRALLYPSLTGMLGGSVHLGCAACPYAEATRRCSALTHLCSLPELLSGGLHTARAMGWLAASPEVWHLGEEGPESLSGMSKLGLCCAD